MLNVQQLEAPVPAFWLRDCLLISSMACVALAMGLYNPVWALGGLAILFAGVMIGDHVELVLLPLLVVMPLDLKIGLGSQPAYLDLLPGILAIPLLRKLLTERHKVNLWPMALTGFVVMAVLTTIGRADKVSWMLDSGLRLIVVLVFATAIASYGEVERIILAAGWSLVPAVGYAIYQMLIGGLGPAFNFFSGQSGATDVASYWTGRPFSTFGHPNVFGFYCAIVCAMLFAVIVRSEDALRRKIAIGLSLVGMVGVLSTNSRGAWLGLAAVVAVLTFMGYIRVKYLLTGIVFVVAVLYAFSALKLGDLSHASEFGDETIGTRMQLWGAAVNMFLKHPLTGVGWMNFPSRVSSYTDWRFDAPDHAHNIYLSLLAETGLIGFLLFVVPIAIVFRSAAKSCRSDIALLAGVLGLTVFLVHGLVDLAFFGPQAMLAFGVALGLACKARFPQRSWRSSFESSRAEASAP